MRIGVALGSNLGDPLANLRGARKALSHVAGVGPPILCSAIYETAPVDCEPGAGKFLNAAIEFGYEGDLLELLGKIREIETALGRPADHPRYVSRKIDIDLLYADHTRFDSPQLQLPHPRMHERKFVLQPLADIRPELILPGHVKTIRDLLREAADSGNVARSRADW